MGRERIDAVGGDFDGFGEFLLGDVIVCRPFLLRPQQEALQRTQLVAQSSASDRPPVTRCVVLLQGRVERARRGEETLLERLEDEARGKSAARVRVRGAGVGVFLQECVKLLLGVRVVGLDRLDVPLGEPARSRPSSSSAPTSCGARAHPPGAGRPIRSNRGAAPGPASRRGRSAARPASQGAP